jgi:hypothetical protein
MKRLAIVVIVLAVILGGIALPRPTKVEFVNTEPTVVEKEVQVDALEQAIKDAQDAKEGDIKTTAQKAYDEAYSQEMKKVELEVIKSFGEKLDARQIELEKETKVY